MQETQITIRPFATLEEMHACVCLQQAIWQYSDLDVVPHHVFVAAHKSGGQVLGAFDGERAVGFVLAFPAFHQKRAYLHSHMTAVLPEYQNHGVGRRLKLAQRENALAREIDLIEWTFDPLQLKNAHFNVARLGVIARHYFPDLYGRTSSHLHAGLPTDRLLAEWWLCSSRVQDILRGRALETATQHEQISVPMNIGEISKSNTQQAEKVQHSLRLKFQRLFKDSYAVTGFRLDHEHGTYLLEPYED